MIKKLILSLAAFFLIIYFAGEYQPARYYSLLCTDTNAAKDGGWNYDYDSFFIGKNGCLYDPGSISINDIPPVIDTKNTDNPKKPLWYVNGANHRASWVLPEMHLLAKNSGRPVVGIYNSTLGGRFPDVLSDSINESKVAKILASQIVQNISSNTPVYISCNSQGAMHVSHGLQQAVKTLSLKYNKSELEARLTKIHVETAGGAGKYFPDGPQYIHYANTRDPVPYKAGVLSVNAQKGKNAVIVEFTDQDNNALEPKYRWVGPLTMKFINVHGFNMYIQYRQAFEKVYQQRDKSLLRQE